MIRFSLLNFLIIMPKMKQLPYLYLNMFSFMMKLFKIIPLLTANAVLIASFSISAQTLPAKEYTVESISAEPYIDSIKRIGKITFKRT